MGQRYKEESIKRKTEVVSLLRIQLGQSGNDAENSLAYSKQSFPFLWHMRTVIDAFTGLVDEFLDNIKRNLNYGTSQ